LKSISVDVGFGRTKAISSTGEKIMFKSAIGPFQPVQFNYGVRRSGSGMVLSYQGREMFVGDLALSQSTPIATMDTGRTVSFEGLTLLMAAVSALTPFSRFEKINMVVGLPVHHYARYKDEYIKVLTGMHDIKELALDGKVLYSKIIDVVQVKVLPQPFGCYFDLIFDDGGVINNQAIAEGNVGIVDNGYNTLDLLRVENLEYIERRSKGFPEMGAVSVYSTFQDMILRKHGIDIPLEKVESEFSKDYLTIYGEQVPTAELKKECYKIEAEKVLATIKTTWPDYGLLSAIILTGGGIINIWKQLEKEIGKAARITLEPLWANVLGYNKFAKKIWKDEK
jgi:plasmid segregation protein ParM